MLNRIGLIAGNGRFPILFAQNAKKNNIEVIAICINEETSKDIEKYVNKIYWIGVGDLKKLFQILIEEKLGNIVMAGQVKHKKLFDKNIKIDPQMAELLGGIVDKKTDSIIGAVAKKLESNNVNVLDSTIFMKEMLAEKGSLTNKDIEKEVREDISFGLGIAKTIAGLDIGQTVVVKDKTVLAVESIEGTDEAIKRGALYGKEGIVVIKVSKPDQDMRFDVPVIGPDTIRLLSGLKASCLAIESQKTLIIDKDETIRLAEELGVSIEAV